MPLMPESVAIPYFTNNFNTPLSEAEKPQFTAWLKEASPKVGRDLRQDIRDYDLAGAWKAGLTKDLTGGLHLPDTYKKPSHPTFSDESIYHGAKNTSGVGAPTFVAGKWQGDDKAGWVYQPSKEMLSTTHPVPFLQQYLKRTDPDVTLALPAEKVGPK